MRSNNDITHNLVFSTFPRPHDRSVFLLTILTGIFAQGFVSERLIDFSGAAATATNILTHKGLFQLGFTVYLIEMACQVATAVLFYQLLKPANRTVALLPLFLEVTGCVRFKTAYERKSVPGSGDVHSLPT